MPDRRPVYIVDDESEVRQSIAYLLEAAHYHPHVFASGHMFLEAIAWLEPGCVLLDLRMPDMDGLAVLEALGRQDRPFRTIMMTGHGDILSAVSAMKLGAHDFVEKPFDEEGLLSMVGHALVEMDALQQSIDVQAAARARIDRLSVRERDVLIGLMTGRSNKVLAHELGLSVRTIEMHRAHMMDRLEVSTFPDALRLAFHARLFPTDGSSD